MKKLSAIVLLLSVSGVAYSEGSAWLPDDGSTTLSVSITSGSTEDFFIGDNSIDLGGELEGTYVWINASYGYDDIWAFDARTGYARSQLEGNPEEQSDIADTSFGVSYQFINEFEADNGLPTISARFGYTFGGSYETNTIDAIGDGASGVNLSLLVGKSITPTFSIFSDLTYRQRDGGVADGVKFLVGGFYNTPIPRLGVQLSAAGVRTDSDVNIGDPGFGVEQFSQTDRDSDFLIAGANYSLDNGIGLGLAYSALLSGTNVADTDIITFNIGYSF